MQVSFVISDGGVPRASIAGDSGTPAADCFTHAVSQWPFPIRADDTEVHYDWIPAKKMAALAPAEIAPPLEVQREHRGEVSGCYNRRNSGADEGPVDVEVVIGRSGAVLAARLVRMGDRFNGTGVGACILEAVRRWRFPKPAQASRTKLAWHLVRRRGAVQPDPNTVVVAELEPTRPTVPDSAFNVAVIAQAALFVDCRVEQETFVAMTVYPAPDGGRAVESTGSSPTNPELEGCVADRARKLQFPPDAGGGYQGWLFAGDGGVTPYEISLGGGLSKDAILTVIKEHQSEVRFCYEQRLRQRPQLHGKVTAVFTIGPDGSVADASAPDVDSTMQQVADCAIRRIVKWKFPEPIGGGKVTVAFPWIFKPAEPGDEK